MNQSSLQIIKSIRFIEQDRINDVNIRDYDSALEEEDDLLEFMALNRYPQYSIIIDKLRERTDVGDFLNFYTEVIHDICRDIYTYINNVTLLKKFGEMLHQYGGVQLMRDIYYTVLFISPIKYTKNNIISASFTFYLNTNWDGIGNWKY